MSERGLALIMVPDSFRPFLAQGLKLSDTVRSACSPALSPFNSQIEFVILLINHQPYNSYNVSSENLVLDQLIIPKLIVFFFLITCLVDIVLIL